MKPQINMIGILTDNLDSMKKFYRDVLGFKVKLEMDNFVEFESSNVRFALSTNAVMARATGDSSFSDKKSGHAFELAFKVDTPSDVDSSFNDLVSKGARSVKTPQSMPWGQRTAFFADPDGNVHEVFADL